MAAKKKKSVAKKTAPKKALAKKPVAKKAAPKKVVAKKAAAPKRAVVAVAKKSTTVLSTVGSMFTPLDDRLVVAPDVAPEKTAGGLYIPGSATGRPSRGTVLAKGRGRRNKKGSLRPLDVNVGDHVLFAEFSGTKITVGQNEVLILREEDVLGVVNL